MAAPAGEQGVAASRNQQEATEGRGTVEPCQFNVGVQDGGSSLGSRMVPARTGLLDVGGMTQLAPELISATDTVILSPSACDSGSRHCSP